MLSPDLVVYGLLSFVKNKTVLNNVKTVIGILGLVLFCKIYASCGKKYYLKNPAVPLSGISAALHPRCSGSTLRSGKLAAGNVLPCGSASQRLYGKINYHRDRTSRIPISSSLSFSELSFPIFSVKYDLSTVIN